MLSGERLEGMRVSGVSRGVQLLYAAAIKCLADKRSSGSLGRWMEERWGCCGEGRGSDDCSVEQWTSIGARVRVWARRTWLDS